MIKFQPGDLVTRINHNMWWKVICAREHLDPNNVFVVETCNKETLICTGWKFGANPEYFTLVKEITKEEIIVARIKRLYSKCKTTAHWV